MNSKRKEIVFVVDNFARGGITNSLKGIVNNLSDYDISIVFFQKHENDIETMNSFQQVEFIYEPLKYTAKSILKELLLHKSIINIVKFAIQYVIYLVTEDRFSFLAKQLPINYCTQKKFDLAIAFCGLDRLSTVYCLSNIRAERKVMWVHEDCTNHGSKRYLKKLGDTYYKFSHIFCVSQSARRKFVSTYPLSAEIVSLFYNPISYDFIRKQADEAKADEISGEDINILTVGRLSKEKGQLIIPDVVKKMLSRNLRFKWYIIGEGSERKAIENRIREMNLQKNIILLGYKNNPYPYYKKCDIYVQTSLHEGYCISLEEAKCFGLRIISTGFESAKEILENYEDCYIVNYDAESIFNGIFNAIMTTGTEQERIREMNTFSEVQKIADLV